MMPTQKLESVHGLRGIAALMVVLMHFSNFVQTAAPEFSNFLSNGYLGVDVFFVISGLIIYVSTQEPATRNSASFFVRRFCRVALPAWAALALCVLIQPPYLKDLIFSAFFIPLQNASPPFYGYSVLIVAWTLTYELVFYLIFAAALSFSFGRKHRGLTAALLIIVLYGLSQAQDCCSLDPYRAPLFVVDGGQFPAQLLSLPGNPITLEFAVGIFLAWIYVNGWLQRIGPSALLLTAPLAFYLIFKFQYVAGHGLTRGGILAAAIVFYVLCLEAWRGDREQARLKQSGLAPFFDGAILLLGEISYSLYLIHPSIKALANKVLILARSSSSTSIDGFAFFVALVVTLAGAVLFYRWVEVPSQWLGRTLSAHLRVKRLRIATQPIPAPSGNTEKTGV